MAITLSTDTREVITVAQFIEFAESLDLHDLDELATAAPLLRGLANDRTLIVRRLNEEVENSFGASYLPSAQTLYLGGSKHFYVRAAIWPSAKAVTGGRLYQEKFAYHVAHDHNFTFLTVNYLGPGYETEIYEYDHETVTGYVGEPVDLRFLEKTKFGQGSVMLYRASRDVHIQYPPSELTVTLNLMVSPPELLTRDQMYFDTSRRVISGYPADSENSKRVALIRLAALVGDPGTRELVFELAKRHPCRRTRLTAFESLAEQDPARSGEIWEVACRDESALVVGAAHRRLKTLC